MKQTFVITVKTETPGVISELREEFENIVGDFNAMYLNTRIEIKEIGGGDDDE